MKYQLIKAMQRNQLVSMIYISKSGVITKKCIPDQAKRTFIIDNDFAIVPVVYKERGIV
ncbi:transcriptional regulator [Lysinibacillus sp. NPDC096418]|uniref:transcriptional regulator n=1 Tax=Lysinibacillus sp. NPDC096418 TaxID=3364138 RepID=UPI00381B15C0